VGYDGGKKIKGRKRHICVDVIGLLLLLRKVDSIAAPKNAKIGDQG